MAGSPGPPEVHGARHPAHKCHAHRRQRASLDELMRFYGWKSQVVAMGYVEKSKALLSKMAERLSSQTPANCQPEVPPAAPPAPPVVPDSTDNKNVYYFSNIGEGATITINSKIPWKKDAAEEDEEDED
eukprot:TRINITY_DN7952_c0_g1_i1.p3 TRINITY_DN7952_c0_g1~~TRINITY_DN7952_c0_g1_i1.p3  ORF type:complete len:129 (+),score=20.81 TRINITY_DN7952_c0_g1_i1:1072-1458(+)